MLSTAVYTKYIMKMIVIREHQKCTKFYTQDTSGCVDKEGQAGLDWIGLRTYLYMVSQVMFSSFILVWSKVKFKKNGEKISHFVEPRINRLLLVKVRSKGNKGESQQIQARLQC